MLVELARTPPNAVHSSSCSPAQLIGLVDLATLLPHQQDADDYLAAYLFDFSLKLSLHASIYVFIWLPED